MPRHLSTTLTSLALIAGLSACAAEDPPRPEVSTETPVESVATPAVDTTAQAVRAYLESTEYATAWALWPDTEAFYAGGAPHGRLLTTYVNESAERGLERMRAGDGDALPFGSIVVKENFLPDSSLAAVTVMYKHEGYDPPHHDWYWLKYQADGTVDASGRVGSCIDCHAEDGGAARDYLRTAAEQMGG